MGTVIIELIAGITILGTIIYNKTLRNPKIVPYRSYMVCFTTGDTPGTIIRTPWYSKVCKTEDEYEYDYSQVFSIALDSKKNMYFRECGYTGISFVDIETGIEDAWCRMSDK